jgi:hypothetical protein
MPVNELSNILAPQFPNLQILEFELDPAKGHYEKNIEFSRGIEQK